MTPWQGGGCLTWAWHARSLAPCSWLRVLQAQGRGGGTRGGPCPHRPVPRAGPGAEGHHRLPEGQQPCSQLVASLTQEEWGRGGDEEGAPPTSQSDWKGLPWCCQAILVGTFPLGCSGTCHSTALLATVEATGQELLQ